MTFTAQKYPDWSLKKILVAEDEFIDQKYLEKFLSLCHAQFFFTNNGEDAVKVAKNEDFDMVLMDLKLPLKNGFDATKEIKHLFPNLPIIAQTALAFPEHENEAKASGCDDYITKPLNLSVLIKKMDYLFKS